MMCWQVVDTLGAIGPAASRAIPTLNRMLDRYDHLGLEIDIIQALDRIGDPPVAQLVDRFLYKPKFEGRWLLARLGPRAHAAVPALRRAIADPRISHSFRIEVAEALAYIDPTVPESLPVLADALAGQSWQTEAAASALGALGTRARSAIPALAQVLQRDGAAYEKAREKAVTALMKIDPEGRECLPDLAFALTDKMPGVVRAAADAISVLGPNGRSASSALAAALGRDFPGDPGPTFSCASDAYGEVAKALVRVGGDHSATLSALTGALTQQPRAGRIFDGTGINCAAALAAARALGSLGPAARAAVPTLVKALLLDDSDHDYVQVRVEAARTLGRIGPAASAAVPALRRAMAGYGNWVTEAAIDSLLRLDPSGRELAARRLAAIGQRRYYGEVEQRAMLLSAMGRPNMEADALVRKDLADLDEDMRNRIRGHFQADSWWADTIVALARFGPGSRLAIPRLRELTRSGDAVIRMWAEEALDGIR
jgi:HEAT repeat protein